MAKQFGLQPESDIDATLDLYTKFNLLLFPSPAAVDKASKTTSVVQSTTDVVMCVVACSDAVAMSRVIGIVTCCPLSPFSV